MSTQSEASFHVIRTLKPIAPVQPGQVYMFLHDVSTRAGHVHPRDSFLHVEDVTTQCPHGEIGEGDRNWVCRTDHGTSIWATLEQCISRDLLMRVPIYRVIFWGEPGVDPRDNRGRPLSHGSLLPFATQDIGELAALYDVWVSTSTEPPVLYLNHVGGGFDPRYR